MAEQVERVIERGDRADDTDWFVCNRRQPVGAPFHDCAMECFTIEKGCGVAR
ncbi:hypothetical protein D3C72_2554230 [compost metagenome]